MVDTEAVDFMEVMVDTEAVAVDFMVAITAILVEKVATVVAAAVATVVAVVVATVAVEAAVLRAQSCGNLQTGSRPL